MVILNLLAIFSYSHSLSICSQLINAYAKTSHKKLYACFYIECTPNGGRAIIEKTLDHASFDRKEAQKFAGSMSIAGPFYITEMNEFYHFEYIGLYSRFNSQCKVLNDFWKNAIILKLESLLIVTI